MSWLKRLFRGKEAEKKHKVGAIDLRSEAERQVERSARKSVSGEDEQFANRLVRLLAQADREYKTDKNAYEATCKAIQDIGETLCKNGGSERMKKVTYRVRALGGNSRLIEMHWDGICGWQY